jgi:F1F0 ATPase subunit 2
MTSSEIIDLSLAALTGVILGIVFFGVLWCTVYYGIRSKRPALLFSISFLGRTLFVLSGFYLAGAGHWERLVVCLLGFLAGRALISCLLPANTKNGKAANALDPR